MLLVIYIICIIYVLGSLRWIYEKCRLPIVPIYGLFPVKLTYVTQSNVILHLQNLQMDSTCPYITLYVS